MLFLIMVALVASEKNKNKCTMDAIPTGVLQYVLLTRI